MFRLLPVIAASCFQLTALSVEMWSNILRLLDPLSLLATARSDPRFKSICLGDSVLRNNLRNAFEIERRQAEEIIRNPAMSITISREDAKKVFAANVSKKITKKSVNIRQSLEVLKKKPMKTENKKKNKCLSTVKKVFNCRI
ncbi:uncharacterized protein LOC114326798 isoform X1 [Diabrotica virgifera virgifera]|uniref:Uncharacterized protein LOC114326798 n=1 Tax=Diabrotica virgifera virgifera TaxID=50390 RepID=A0A6P7F6C7_DIAVI|nr:uncharacterized protein LOC114326798 isoform X1 [Diabrotica virgifera virgifera]